MKGAPGYPHHAYIRVRLPKFLIIYLRELVRRGNELSPERTSVSAMIEWWMLKMLEGKSSIINNAAEQSPEFRREVQTWIRWVTKGNRQ